MNKILIVIAFFLTGCLASVDAKEDRSVASDGQNYTCDIGSNTIFAERYEQVCDRFNRSTKLRCGGISPEIDTCNRQLLVLGNLEDLAQKMEEGFKKLDEKIRKLERDIIVEKSLIRERSGN